MFGRNKIFGLTYDVFHTRQTARIADLNEQLQKSKTQAAAYLEKNRHQDQAILSAQREHSKLLTMIRKLQSENTRLQQDIRTMHDLKENGSLHGDRPQVESFTNEKGNSHLEEENRKLRQRIQTLEDAKTVSRKSMSLLEAIQVGVHVLCCP